MPPAASLSYLLILPLQLLLRFSSPQELPLPLLLCLCCASLGAWLERYERLRANVLAEAVDQWVINRQGLSPERAVGLSLAAQCALRFILYLVCWTALYGIMAWARGHNFIPVVPGMSWSILYGIGFMGAVLSLRVRRAYAVLMAALLILVLVRL